MKKAAALIGLLMIPLLWISLPPSGSFYYSSLDVLVCYSGPDCRHEIGHKMDSDLGDVSESAEFGLAIAAYLYMRSKYFTLDEITDVIQGTGGIFFYSPEYQPFGKRAWGSAQQELYANIYAAIDGDISRLHPSLQALYSNDPKYIDLYECLMEQETRLCGTSLHAER